jgi:ABC-type Fe3+-hydroxamate transport system substrate-binding protein
MRPTLYREISDALGRLLRVPAPPVRMVSLVPSQTELLFELGCGERIVGVSDYCVEPQAALRDKTRVGGQKDPNLDTLRALRPDLVIANKEENLRRDVDALAAEGIPTFVTDVRTVEAALQLPATLGVLCGAEIAEIERVLALLTQGISAARTWAAQRVERPRVLTLVWRDPFIVAGPDTYLSAVLATLGAVNAAADLDVARERRYPKLSLPELRALRPDRLLLPTEPYPFSESDRAALEAELDLPVRLIDGPTACWYGPRTARILDLAPALSS